MSASTTTKRYRIYNSSCYSLPDLKEESADAVITDPPYGIGFQSHAWDKALPDRQIWEDCYRVLKPGGFALVFSAVRSMHRVMVDLEDSGFRIRDVLFWSFINGMPKSRDVGLDIDKALGVESEQTGTYQYVQGYKKGGAENYYASDKKYKYEPSSSEGKFFQGWGIGIKPCYEPIIMVQKPIEQGMSVAENMLKYRTGALNLEDTRMPYEPGEGKVGHNPHPKGRVIGNMLRTEPHDDGYDKFFLVPKVRQHAEDYNFHPTKKPVDLMEHLIKLVTHVDSVVVDPFMGSGSTALACMFLGRKFVGYESDESYFKIAKRRMEEAENNGKQGFVLNA